MFYWEPMKLLENGGGDVMEGGHFGVFGGQPSSEPVGPHFVSSRDT